MAGAQLGAAFRQIQRLFSEGSSTGLSDTQLLNRFATCRDEAAFAAILARHGPMVLAVCRGVLRNPSDAEDAFQATFLVLARKAGSAWAEGQLGGWLHKAAYRIAVRASADTARRRGHEHRAAEGTAVEYTHADLNDDLRRALHDELARLPARFRLPVVLCDLEGLTHAQAAVQLRCGEASVRRRLAQARERLRARLTSRGFAPSDAAVGLTLARETGTAVPPVCIEATIRAVMSIAAGEAMATVVGARVARLSQGRLTMITIGWKTTATAAISVAAVACLAAGIGAQGGKSAATTPGETKSSLTAAANRPPTAPIDQKARPSRTHVIKGLVLSPNGKPASSATVYWLGTPRSGRSSMPRGYKEKPEDREKMLAQGTTDASGRFELVAEFDTKRTHPVLVQVIVKATGAGLLGRTFSLSMIHVGPDRDVPLPNRSFADIVTSVEEGTSKESSRENQRLTFRLRAPATIEGQLLAPAGTPAVGVKVFLKEFHDNFEYDSDEVSTEYSDEGQPLPLFDFWPSSWTTDENGRFRIEGIVPEKTFAHIYFLCNPDFVDEEVFVSTGAPLSDSLPASRDEVVDAKFTYTLQPARPVTGIVTDKETGKPLAGVIVEVSSAVNDNRRNGDSCIEVRTDESGRYRAGAAGDSFWVVAHADPASGYLPIRQDRDEWPKGAKVLEINLALPPASILRGRVVEAETGRPVAEASVIYKPELGSPFNSDDYEFDNPVLTDQDGNFVLTVLPGEGWVFVEAPTPDFMRVSLTYNRSSPAFPHGFTAFPHGFARLDLPAGKDQDNPPVQVTLRKGVRLEARFVGPDGRPVEEMVTGCCAGITAGMLDHRASPLWSSDGLFRLEGADPERTYRFFFVQSKRRLGAVIELKFDSKGPAVVQMQPTATAKGIWVDRQGKPLKEIRIRPELALTKEDRELTQDDFDDEGKVVTYTMLSDASLLPSYSSEFCYDKLIPGARYYVGAGESHHSVPILKPGEVLDLGKIVIKQPKGQ